MPMRKEHCSLTKSMFPDNVNARYVGGLINSPAPIFLPVDVHPRFCSSTLPDCGCLLSDRCFSCIQVFWQCPRIIKMPDHLKFPSKFPTPFNPDLQFLEEIQQQPAWSCISHKATLLVWVLFKKPGCKTAEKSFELIKEAARTFYPAQLMFPWMIKPPKC